MDEFSTIDDLLSAVAEEAEVVTIGGKKMKIWPVGMLDLLRVIRRFPALRSIFFQDTETDSRAVMEVILDAGPEAVAAVLAIARGKPGDVAEEQKLARLPDRHLVPLISAVLKATMPNGLSAFFDQFRPLVTAVGFRSED